MTRWKRSLLGAACAAALMGTTSNTAEGQALYATSSTVMVRFVGYSAAYTSDLYFFPSYGSYGKYILTNHTATPGSHYLATSTASVGQELVFGIYVHNTNQWYYTGDPGRNSDGALHANLTDLGSGKYQINVGFEDLPNGGDKDYNDLTFGVSGAQTTVTPEPISMILLGSGLFGVGGAGALRRRRQQQQA